MFTTGLRKKLQGLKPSACIEKGSIELTGPRQMGRDCSQGVHVGNNFKQTSRTKATVMELPNPCEHAVGTNMHWLHLGISVRFQDSRLEAEG